MTGKTGAVTRRVGPRHPREALSCAQSQNSGHTLQMAQSAAMHQNSCFCAGASAAFGASCGLHAFALHLP